MQTSPRNSKLVYLATVGAATLFLLIIVLTSRKQNPFDSVAVPSSPVASSGISAECLETYSASTATPFGFKYDKCYWDLKEASEGSKLTVSLSNEDGSNLSLVFDSLLVSGSVNRVGRICSDTTNSRLILSGELSEGSYTNALLRVLDKSSLNYVYDSAYTPVVDGLLANGSEESMGFQSGYCIFENKGYGVLTKQLEVAGGTKNALGVDSNDVIHSVSATLSAAQGSAGFAAADAVVESLKWTN